MTMEMACYFAFIALDIQEVFAVIFIKDYKYNEIQYVAMLLLWLFLHIFRLFLINYECERIRIKVRIFKVHLFKICSSKLFDLLNDILNN